MGTSSSRDPKAQACTDLARQAARHAQRAEELVRDAQAAAASAAAAKEEVLAVDVAASAQPDPASVAEPPARTSWWGRGRAEAQQRPSAEVQALERRFKAQVAAVEKEALAQSAAARTAAAALEAKVASAQAEAAAATVRAREDKEALEPLRKRVQDLESTVRTQRFFWVAAFLAGLTAGAVLGGIVGATAAATSSPVASTAGTPSLGEGHGNGLVGAVAGLTVQMLSLSNVLNAVGGLALSGVYFYFMVLYWGPLMQQPVETSIRLAARQTALLSVGYAGILVFVGDRIWAKGDDGSRILGGLFYCGAAVAVPVIAACTLRVGGWRWLAGINTLGSPTRRSLADVEGWPALAVLIVATTGIAASVALYLRSGFPLLMAPVLICSYVGFLAATIASWKGLNLPRFGNALLQPEVLGSLLFGVLALTAASQALGGGGLGKPPSVSLALLIAGMNALLLALPACLLGCLDPTGRNRSGLDTVSIYQPADLCERCAEFILRVRGTPEFAQVATAYMVVWITIMTKALRLHLWTCRPFALISIIALCAALPFQSILWTLSFRVPIGLWLLGVVVFLESTANVTADPILSEVLRWLGPQPAPFLDVVNSLLQVSTTNTALSCLLSGVFCAQQQIGGRSWALALLCWLLCALSLTARLECKGSLLSLCLALWALGYFLYGVRQLPSWDNSGTRLVVAMLASRICLLGSGSLVIVLVCGSVVCFICVTMAFGESDPVRRVRDVLLNPEEVLAPAASLLIRLAMSGLIFLQGVANDEALLVTLGCFCTYVSLASTVASKDNISWAIVVAMCGLATMVLGEVVQTHLVPMQNALIAIMGHMPWQSGTASESAHGPPVDLRAIRALLHDLMALVSGEDASAEAVATGAPAAALET